MQRKPLGTPAHVQGTTVSEQKKDPMSNGHWDPLHVNLIVTLYNNG